MSKRRIGGALIGLVYGFLYGVWVAVFASGGGHGFGLTWVALFIFVDWFGFYFVIMGTLVVNVRTLLSRVVFATLVLFNIAVSAILVLSPIVSDQGEETRIFRKSWSIDPSGLILCAALHFLPSIALLTFFVVKTLFSREGPEERLVDLNL